MSLAIRPIGETPVWMTPDMSQVEHHKPHNMFENAGVDVVEASIADFNMTGTVENHSIPAQEHAVKAGRITRVLDWLTQK
jgi:hypothetical protein